jgi:hypothetical protein
VECLSVDVEQINKDRKLKIINEMHKCQGVQRTVERIKLYIIWPGLEQDVTQYERKCKICQVNKELNHKIKQRLEITDTHDFSLYMLCVHSHGSWTAKEES